jgi:uncharacterized Zn finger protein
MSLADHLSAELIEEMALPSNLRYGSAIYERGAVKIIEQSEARAEAWVGGLEGTVREGAGSRRRTELKIDSGTLRWHCTGNPKNHQIFCKHCVALALAVLNEGLSGD